jgi:hypothetical protein
MINTNVIYFVRNLQKTKLVTAYIIRCILYFVFSMLFTLLPCLPPTFCHLHLWGIPVHFIMNNHYLFRKHKCLDFHFNPHESKWFVSCCFLYIMLYNNFIFLVLNDKLLFKCMRSYTCTYRNLPIFFANYRRDYASIRKSYIR